MPDEDAVLWILDPYKLNTVTLGIKWISFFDNEYAEGYYRYFIDDQCKAFGKFPKKIIALGVNPPNPRIVAQHGCFTFHNPEDFSKPLEELHPKCVKKFVIKHDMFDYAKKFLIQSGINEFSMFPDLDGLARYLRKKEMQLP